ncbi:unnamed protein product [Penicillium pancosmium]
MGRKSTACQNCRSIKALCTKQLPCVRCKRLLLSCRYEPTTFLENDHRKPRPKAGITKAKHTKSQSGCLGCRRRRKKCDEKQPACSDCERLRLPCIRPGDVHELGGRSECGVESHVEETADALLALDAFGLWAATDSPGRRGQDTTASLTSFSDWLALIETENIAETISNADLAGSTALVNTGHFGDDGSENVATFLPCTALNKLTGVTLDAVAKWRAVEKYLLDHFLQSVSRALVIAEDNVDPFLCVVVPMALKNTMVQHALFALSACHLSRIYPVFESDFYFHRSKALQELMCELEDLTAPICAVAATLLLTFTEICTGTSRKWIIHLHGARALLSQGVSDMAGPPADTLIEIYNYLSCMASVTSEMAPGRLGDSLQLSSSNATPSTSAFIHPLLGLSASIYESLASISRFAARTRNKHPSLEELEETKEIERALKAWQPPKVAAHNESRNFTEARAMGFALQQATIMRLQQITKRLENNDPNITKAADGILSALSLIRPGSEMEGHMLFPLFMAGVGSITKPHRLTIEYRLKVMEATIGFGNISIAHKVLAEIWRKANEGELMDWEGLMRCKYPGFIFV